MATAPVSDLTPMINAVLDRARRELGIGSDADLGSALGVSDQAIYLWRRGEVGKSARVLLPLVFRQYQIAPGQIRPKYRRRRVSKH